jgi:hypothetical protein
MSEIGMTVYPLSVRKICAPSARRQEAVASISAFVNGHANCVLRSEKAAQISNLCAWDFEGIAESVPYHFPG